MRFEETEEQSMIRELVRDFAETVLQPTVEHRDANQIAPSEEWKAFLDFGLAPTTLIKMRFFTPLFFAASTIAAVAATFALA